jgi:hypothetical protein
LRKRYLEASEILYTTNTIRVAQPSLSQLLIRQTLVPNSPIVIDPFHLPTVTSLEMAWEFKLWSSSDKPISITRNRLRLQETLHLLPNAFPSLRWLHVIFASNALGDIRMDPFQDTNVAEVEEVLLQPLLQAIKFLSKAKYISFALPSNMFFAVRQAAQRSKRDSDGTLDEEYLKDRQAKYKKFGIWGVEEWYPFGVDEGKQGRAGEGYWVACGPEC